MRQTDHGLKSEPLRAALASALAGQSQKLEDLLVRHGGGSDPNPNLRLAAALGVELAAADASPMALLARFAGDDAAPDDPRVFLPVAAAHAWVALLSAGREEVRAWASLGELAADERAPVRLGTRDALLPLALRPDGALALVRHADEWLEMEDRERRFSAAALVLEILAERRVMTALASEPPLLAYLSRAIEEIAGAPRSAERLEGRRRLLAYLPPALGTAVVALGAGEVGPRWLEAICRDAKHPDIRKALSDAILRLRNSSLGQSSATARRLREILQASAKPLRDPTRLRPGTGRGKASRRVR